MAKGRVVLDTSVIVSALLWTGIPHRLLQAAESGDFALVTCPSIIDEMRNVLVRPKFASRIAALNTSIGELTESFLSIVEIIQEPKSKAVITRDPDDDKILACALASRARWIVSGDSHLLDLKQYRGIPVLTPKQFWESWSKK